MITWQRVARNRRFAASPVSQSLTTKKTQQIRQIYMSETRGESLQVAEMLGFFFLNKHI